MSQCVNRRRLAGNPRRHRTHRCRRGRHALLVRSPRHVARPANQHQGKRQQGLNLHPRGVVARDPQPRNQRQQRHRSQLPGKHPRAFQRNIVAPGKQGRQRQGEQD